MINKVILIGRAGKAPDLHKTKSEKKVAKFSLVTTKAFKDETTENGWREENQWHNIVVWGKSAETVSKKIQKGDIVYVEGEVTYRNYENKDGQTVYITEIVGFARSLTFRKTEENNTPKERENNEPLETDDMGDLPF